MEGTAGRLVSLLCPTLRQPHIDLTTLGLREGDPHQPPWQVDPHLPFPKWACRLDLRRGLIGIVAGHLPCLRRLFLRVQVPGRPIINRLCLLPTYLKLLVGQLR